MTLHTRVRVTSPGVEPRAAFTKMRQIIGAGEQYDSWESPDPTSDNKYRRTMDPGFHMSMGQGLPALMWVDHWDGDLEPEHQHDKFCFEWTEEGPTEKLECEQHFEPRQYLEINYDTAYGYRAENNASCGDLHAWITREIGAWLDAQGVSWDWYDESGNGWDHGPGWGTLGDPEVGAIGSTKQRVDRDDKRAFGELVTTLLGGQS